MAEAIFMPRAKTHAIISSGVGIAYSLAVQAHRRKLHPLLPNAINPVHVIACTVASFIGGCAPDIFEPASRTVGPNHRGPFHSLSAGIGAVSGSYILGTDPSTSIGQQWLCDLLGAFYAGYASHLAADFCTPKSLHFLNRSF